MRVRPCVTAVVVTYQSSGEIAECLQSLFDTAAPWLKQCRVVDNHSTDGTEALVRRAFPQAELIAETSNLGFARAVNHGAAGSDGDYLLILNPDTRLHENAVAELAHFLDHRARAVACGPCITDERGEFRTDSRRSFPTPVNSFGRLFGLERIFPHSRWAAYKMPGLDSRIEMMTDTLSGSCMLLRRAAFAAVGGFDEDYFLFGEDIDLCWKLKRAGGEIWYVPSASVMHRKGVSMSKASHIARREFYRAMLLYIDKRLAEDHSALARGFMKAGVRLHRMLHLSSGH